MTGKIIKYEMLLLLASAVWGFAFVAQRVGMEYVGPFTFNGIRFALGGAALLPMLAWGGRRADAERQRSISTTKMLLLGIMTGSILFAGASLQQMGIVYTTAGKAGFITGLYVVIVPVLGLMLGQRAGALTWVGALSAAAGLYLLSAVRGAAIAKGDLLVLMSAFFFAAHVLMIGWLSAKIFPIKLALIQYSVTSIFSLAVALLFESISLTAIRQAAAPIIYGGLMSVGLAYTLQIIAQIHTPPAHTAIILSLESVFGAIGGFIILHEIIPLRGLVGCALMLAGMLVSQISAKTDYRARAARAEAIGSGS